MVGNGVLLYEATGDRKYLVEAEVLADQSLHYYQSTNELERHFPAFNAIFFKNLLKLEAVNHNPHYRKVMEQYAANLWHTVHPEYGVFFHEGSRKSILNQAAVIQVFSYLATPAPAAGEASHSA